MTKYKEADDFRNQVYYHVAEITVAPKGVRQ